MTDKEKYRNLIKARLKEEYVSCTEEAAEKISDYMAGVLEKNKSINLTAITDEESFIRDHIVDSASLTKLDIYKGAKTVCDVGTGAGFPGVILAALSPDKEFTLIDSLAKRLKVINELSESAGITNIRLVHARAEDAGHDSDLREKFDIVTARAVARLSVLSELCVPFVKKGGYFISYKASSCEEEMKQAQKAFNILGVAHTEIQDAGVSGTEHVFAVMKKERKTPEKYPRKAGEPSRKPL